MNPKKDKVNLYFILGTLMTIVGIGVIPAGVAFILDPTGHRSGASLDVLSSTPFIDFFFPGVFLLFFIGVGNFTSAVVGFLKIEVSCVLGIAMGILMMLWIIVQYHWVGYAGILQPVNFILALAEAVTGFLLMRKLIWG